MIKSLNAISCIMFDEMNKRDFVEWLNEKIQKSGLSQSEIARRGKISKASVSNALDINGSTVGWDVAFGLAQALQLPPVLVFRKAGLLPVKKGSDELREEALILFDELDVFDQEETIEFMKMKYRRSELREEANELSLALESIPPDDVEEILGLINDYMEKHGLRRVK